jgi:PAS domain S-box-containing protein
MPDLSEYTLTELLHAGSYAVLHRGYRNADRAPVVVKLLHSEYPNPREIARLRHEYLICRDLDAPGIVRAYALVKVGHGLAVILEDFGGRPLLDIIRSQRLDLKTALQLAASLADAVGAVHDRHIIHKDIKPHNILVNPATGVVKLTDFGIATRLFQETHKEAPPDALEGTLSYMSPEQTGRMNRVLDNRTDFYSLGVTLYEMLTGTLPFVTTEPLELVHSHIARTPLSPRERAPELPEVVSAIVMKLLAKAAEDRYQSAHGLKADLDACLSRWIGTGAIAPFPLGQKDVPGTLSIVQKLYGREAETAALLAAFDRASAGGAELLLVSGYAGIGKSALVSEIHQAIGRRGGLFCGGKFDQLSRNIPYTAVAAALQELVRHLLAEPDEELARGRRDLLAAIGSNGQLLSDLIPELALLIGPQPAVPELGPTESQNRFDVVFQNFLRVFTTPAHPLVLFLDDLQWADPASLKLLSLLLSDPERSHLLIIGAYRDHEVGPGHLLSLTLDDLRKNGAHVSEIALPPLGLSDVTNLIADTLGCERVKVQPLARVAFDKTHGNPFFLSQLLKSLHAEGRITFDRGAGAWVWDLERIRAAEVTDNVVDFMARKIARLAPETQRVLLLAACIGHQFDLKALSVISELSPQATATTLWESLREGLVLPLDAEYRFLAELDEERTDTSTPIPPFEVAYRFLHDRVQQAAYSLIEERHKQEVHLRVGRLLRDQSDAKELEERLFAIVDHLNLGAKLIGDRDERIDLARSNLSAGKRAKAATAYQAALGYLEAAAALVDEACWEEAYSLSFALNIERAECSYLNGRFDQAESLLKLLLSRAQYRADQAQVYKLLIVFSTARGDFAGAIRFGRSGLALFGIDLPETGEPQKAALDAELAAIKVNLAGRRIEELVDAPLVDVDHRIPLELLVQMSPASFFSGPPLDGLISTLQTNLCLKHGRSDLAAFAYAYASMTQVSPLGQYEDGCEFFRVSCALDEQFDNIALRSKTNVILVSIAHFFISFRAVLPYVARAQRAALETGDFLFLSFTCYHDVMPRLCAGEELSSVSDVLQKAFALAHRARSELVIATLIISRQMIAALLGRTRSRSSLSDDDYDEALHLAEMEEAKSFGFAVTYRHTVKLTLLCLYGDHQGALEEAARAEATAGAAAVFHFATDVPFYEGLSLAALYPSAPAADKERYAARLAERQAQIATWAESCPENYRHKQLLLGAEAARITGKHNEAEALYDEAIEVARGNDLPHHEALANELAARYYLSRGKKKIARLYMNDAHYGYLRWGATEKASELVEKYPSLLSSEAASSPRYVRRNMDTATSHTATLFARQEQFDLISVTKASQAMSQEIIMESLLKTLMLVLMEAGGAQKGSFILARNGSLYLESTAVTDSDGVHVRLDSSPLQASEHPSLIISYVRRSHKKIALHDASAPNLFSSDEYIVKIRPKSVLCLPILWQAKLLGILYLENNFLVGAFTSARISILELLAAQAAISLETARLYSNLNEANEAMARAHAEVDTERLRLKESEERLRAILDNSTAVIYLKDTEGRYLLVSRRYKTLFHVADEQILGKTDYAIWPKETADAFTAHDKEVIRLGKPIEWEEVVPHEDGLHTYISIKFPLFDSRGIPYASCGISTDITERKRGEEERSRLLEQLKESLRLRDEFISIASHELKTPLTPLRLHMQILERVLRDPVLAQHPQAERLSRMISTAESQLNRLSGLVDALLDVSRIRVGKLTLEREDVDLSELVLEAIDRFREECKAVGCELTVDRDSRVIGHWDRLRIEQAIANLLTNAMKYGTGRPIRLSVSSEGGIAKMSIQDHGVGIAPEDQERIFNRFERAVSFKSFGGLGLGLYITRQIVEAHGGTISVESRLGDGATFIVRLPCGSPERPTTGGAVRSGDRAACADPTKPA